MSSHGGAVSDNDDTVEDGFGDDDVEDYLMFSLRRISFFYDDDIFPLTMHARAKMRRLTMGLLFFVLMLFCEH